MSEKNTEWYGTLPKNWSTPKMSYICNTITDYTASGSFASLAENVIYRDTEDYAMLVRTADLSRKRDINPVFIDEKAYNFLNNSNLFGGELIMSNVGSVGDVYLYEPLYKKASLAPNAIMVRANGYEKFLFYLFSTKQAVEGLLSITNTTTQPKFNKTQLRSFRVPFPNQLIMEKIVKHLDKKTEQIEDIENTINKEIENLENYKKSLITEAVTKGLDKNVLMKDSGIDWIGEIPIDSKIVRLKHLVSRNITDGTHQTPDYEDEDKGYPFLSSKDITKGYIDWSDIKYITKNLHKKLQSETKVERNDILLAKNGTTGIAAIIDTDKVFDIYVTLALIRPNTKLINPRFLLYSINSSNSKKQFDEHLVGIGVPNLHLNLIKNTFIIIHSLDEQKRISAYLDYKFKIIDETISLKQKQLHTLEEYKKSLIYEYVTGKKEV